MKNSQKIKFSNCKCKRCGKPFVSRKNNAKYCQKCKGEVPAERDRLSKESKKNEFKDIKPMIKPIVSSIASFSYPVSNKIKNLDAIRNRIKRSKEFLSKFEYKDLLLITLRDELYDGSWESMRNDLEDRLNSKPVIFKLVDRIKYDLKVLDMFQTYEKENKINLKEVM